MSHKSYFDGNDFYDAPQEEYLSAYMERSNELYTDTGVYVFPCYVYDRQRKLIRIEYPKFKTPKKWTSCY